MLWGPPSVLKTFTVLALFMVDTVPSCLLYRRVYSSYFDQP
jgi:hypothetical protein